MSDWIELTWEETQFIETFREFLAGVEAVLKQTYEGFYAIFLKSWWHASKKQMHI